MSDTTPPEGTRAQRADPLVAAIGELIEAQRQTREMVTALAVDMAEVARSVANLDNRLHGAVNAFTELHADLQQAERDEAEERRRMHADIRLVLEAVRGLGVRLSTAEAAIDALRARGANGHG